MSVHNRLLRYLLPYRRGFLVAFVLMLATIGGDLVIPYLLGRAVDEGLASGRMNAVIYYAALLLGATAFRSTTMYFQWRVQQRVGQNVIRDLRDTVYGRLQQLPASFYRQMATGQIMSRVTSDVEAVQEYIGWGFLLLLAAAASFFGTIGVLLWIDWQLTLAATLPLIALVAIIVRFNSRIGAAWEAEREQMGRLTTVLQENISGIRIVKSFARESLARDHFRAENDANRDRNLDRARLEAGAFPALDFLTGAAFIILALVGAWRAINGQLTVGTFFAYQWYLWGIIWPARFLGWLISTMRQTLAAAPRLFEIMDAPVAIDDRPTARPLANVRGDICFEDVHFAFDDAPDRDVFAGLDLHIRPGEVVAILGGTGSGKSSLINLIPRFQDVTAGRVVVDGRDVRDITLASLRHHIGVVPQESFLFSATVRDNIAYGRPDATEADIVHAARLAQAHDFIVAMEKGYDTQIGERGVRLSGGQKQRLALARAILVDPAILILDEATSAVDTETEHEIQQALEQVMANRTSLIIAQRLSTIKHADRIVVLKDGAVAESGTHAELLALGGEYARIYDLQYREQDELAAELQARLRARLPASNGQADLPVAV